MNDFWGGLGAGLFVFLFFVGLGLSSYLENLKGPIISIGSRRDRTDRTKRGN